MPDSLEMRGLQARLRAFADERDWKKFHDPKNLSMALVVEAGELVEIFQWLTSEQASIIMDDPTKSDAVREELADVYGYLLRLADILGVSLNEALAAKIEVNGSKYPIEKSLGNATKYTFFKTHNEDKNEEFSQKKPKQRKRGKFDSTWNPETMDILFVRAGYFYETYDESASLLSELTGIKTFYKGRRTGGTGGRLAAGIPVGALDSYIEILKKAKLRVEVVG